MCSGESGLWVAAVPGQLATWNQSDGIVWDALKSMQIVRAQAMLCGNLCSAWMVGLERKVGWVMAGMSWQRPCSVQTRTFLLLQGLVWRMPVVSALTS